MDSATFTRRFSKLFHVTFAANARSITQHGLQSVATLAQTYAFTPEERHASLTERRICIQNLHGIALRDQHTAPESKMKSCLVKITPVEWLQLLNTKVFFFLSLDRARRLIESYAAYENLLLEIDTATLLSQYESHASVCRIVSGSFLYKPVPRGRDSFIPIAQYAPVRKNDVPAEFTVDCSIPNIMNFAKSIPVE